MQIIEKLKLWKSFGSSCIQKVAKQAELAAG